MKYVHDIHGGVQGTTYQTATGLLLLSAVIDGYTAGSPLEFCALGFL